MILKEMVEVPWDYEWSSVAQHIVLQSPQRVIVE